MDSCRYCVILPGNNYRHWAPDAEFARLRDAREWAASREGAYIVSLTRRGGVIEVKNVLTRAEIATRRGEARE